MTKGNDQRHENDSDSNNSSEKKEDDANRNRTVSNIRTRTRSSRAEGSEDKHQTDRTTRRKSWRETPTELGIITRRRKRISSGNKINVKREEESEENDVRKKSEDVPLDESTPTTSSSSSPQPTNIIGKQSKEQPNDSPSTSSETKINPKTELIEIVEEESKENEEEEMMSRIDDEVERKTSKSEEDEKEEERLSKSEEEEEGTSNIEEEEEEGTSKIEEEEEGTSKGEEEGRSSKCETDKSSSSEEDDEDTKPLSTFLNDSKTLSVSKEESESENVAESVENDGVESPSNDKDNNCDEKEEEEDEEMKLEEDAREDSCVNKDESGYMNLDEEGPPQGGPLSHDGDSCDSVNRKQTHDSDSCSASVTSGDGSRTKSRNKEYRPKIDFRVGAKMEARDCMNMWYPSKIIQVDWDDKEVLIHFERWNSRFDEWVSMDSPRLRGVTRTSSRKEKTDHIFRVFKGYRVGEVVLAKWADCKMYPAKILKILPDFSYSVVFYDGFERTVQSINVKKLPPEMIGQVNFKNVPPPLPPPPPPSNSSQPTSEKRARTSTSKSSESVKLKAHDRKSSTDRSEKRSSSKTRGSSSATSSSKGNGTGVSSKKTKLLVGGIFQAKRHKLTVKTGNSFSSHKTNKHSSSSSKMKNSKLSSKSSHRSKQKKKDTSSSLEADVFLGSTDDGNSIVDVPSKQFVIEEDHNHFKCPMGDCGKGFRKESLLSSHIKHYHREVTRPTVLPIPKNRKRNVSGALKETKPPVKLPAPVVDHKPLDTCIVTELVIAEQQQLQRHPQHMSNFEGNLDRKMITEKRRQLLLQKRLETVYKKRQQAALTEKNRLELLERSRQAKRARLSESRPEKSIDAVKHELEIFSNKAEEEETTLTLTSKKKRRRKPFHPFIGERRKRKKKLLERSSKLRLPDTKSRTFSGKSLLVTDMLNSNESQHDKRKLDQVVCVSDDESTTTMYSDNSAFTDHDKSVLEELTKEFKQFTRNRMAVRTFKEWGESGRQEVVNCRCELQEEEGLMMQCEVCLSWQHGMCFNIDDESKVPEKYICFACENPRGLRHSFRYRHHQDWFKRGEMATFKFLPKQDNWKLKEDMLRTHNLSSHVIALNEVLRSLRHKLHLIKDGDVSSLHFWSSPWVTSSKGHLDDDPRTQSGETLRNETLIEEAMLLDEENEPWSFDDHSYSNADRTTEDNRVPATQPMLEPFLEPEIEGIQVTVSTSSPQHDVAYETEVTVKTDPDSESAALTSVVTASVPDIVSNKQSDEVTDGEPIPLAPQSSEDQNASIPKLNEVKQCPLTSEETKQPPKLVPTILNKIVTAEQRKDADRVKKDVKAKPFRNNRNKNATTKEFSLYECQLNLLDHIEQLQEELDKRMNELNEQLDKLESSYEPLATFNDNSEDRLIEMPRVKRLLKGMTVDLNKVRRMSLYSC